MSIFSPPTSGGLLLAVPEDVVAACRRLADAGALCHAVVGRFTVRNQYDVVVE